MDYLVILLNYFPYNDHISYDFSLTRVDICHLLCTKLYKLDIRRANMNFWGRVNRNYENGCNSYHSQIPSGYHWESQKLIIDHKLAKISVVTRSTKVN